jgi:hypothetical protein
MTALPKPEIRDLRPSVVIAEALVDRQGPNEIVDRARELGFSQCLTTAVVHACCKSKSTHPDQIMTTQNNAPAAD